MPTSTHTLPRRPSLFTAERFRWIEFGSAPSIDFLSIAVLPLANLSRDPEQEYFVDGMTDTLITELSRISALRVISRQSVIRFKGTNLPMPEIAQKLNVDWVVEGSALLIGEQVRITAQLIEAATDQHLWADAYDRDLRDVLAIHSEVASAIAREIRIVITPEEAARLASVREVNPETYQLWLKGHFHLRNLLNQESFERARGLFLQAIKIDPQYAPAHAGLARAYMFLGSWHASGSPRYFFGLAKAAVEHAIELDPAVADAHIVLSRIRFMSDWDWAGAERAYKKQIALDPSGTYGRIGYANFLIAMGRFNESIEIGRQTLALDPLSPDAYNELGWALSYADRDEEALELFRAGLEIEPDRVQTHGLIMLIDVKNGEYDKALASLEQGELDLQTMPPAYLGLFGQIYGLAGRQTKARAILAELRERRTRGEYVPASSLADVHIGLGEYDEALQWLETAYDERDVRLVWLNQSWEYERVRADPRFQAMLDRMNFPGVSAIPPER